MELIRVCEKKMKNSKCSVPPTLPDDMMREILLRLPVRSLLRLKYVCKSWFSLISDPQFAESHFDMGLAPTHRLLVHSYSKFSVNCNSLDIDAPLHSDSDKLVLEIPLPPLYVPGEVYYTRFVVSCRGLILLISKRVANRGYLFEFVAWNPLTNFRKRIPGIRTEDLIGFGYDSSTHDYLLVNVDRRVRFNIINVEWFSFRTNAWTCKPITYQHFINLSEPGVLVNDALHWLVSKSDHSMLNTSGRRIIIMVFDLRERRISEILLPDDFSITSNKPKIMQLKIMAGCLCLSVVEKGVGISTWMMKQYKVESSWIKSFVMNSNCDPLLSKFDPICFTRNGQILGSNAKTLVKVSDKGELLEHNAPEHMVDESGVEFCVYRESLLATTWWMHNA